MGTNVGATVMSLMSVESGVLLIAGGTDKGSDLAPLIEEFLNLDTTTRLSPAALEALSIIAYKQPVTRPQVDAIRGVNSDGVMRSLLSKGLIQESGRADGPGRPILYNSTPEFLQHFGLTSLSALPTIDVSELVAKDGNQPVLKG